MSVANLVGDGLLVGERYRLGERLGAGSAGDTYAAIDEQTGQRRAVKLFSKLGGGNDTRVIGEFRRLHGTAHPSIVRVHDVGTMQELGLYLVMDLASGPPLTSIATIAADVARRHAFETAARDLADALAYLHGRDVVHADICPANIRLRPDGGPILFDFGLALPVTHRGREGGARGTLGYAAPEALVGDCGPASDLFALGATLFEAWTGTPPFGVGLEAVQRMLSARAPLLSSVRAGLPAAWDDILARLLAPQAEQRYPNARELLRDISKVMAGSGAPIELELRAPFPGGDPLAGIVVGRQPERDAVRFAIERLAEGAAPCSVVALAGATGSGRRTIIDLAVRDVTIGRAAGLLPSFTLWHGDLDHLATHLTVSFPHSASESDAAHQAHVRFAALADGLERQALERPLCVVLESDPQAVAFASFLAGAEPSGRVLVVLATSAALERRFARTLALVPLGRDAIAELVARAAGQAAPDHAVQLIEQVSSGHAAMVAALARRLVDALRRGEGDSFRVDHTGDLQQLLAASFLTLGRPARRMVASVALLGSAATETGLDVDQAASAELDAERAGWLTGRQTGTRRLPSELHRDVVMAALGSPDLRDLAVRAVAALPEDDLNRADALAVVGDRTQAAQMFRDAAARAVDAQDLARAALLLQRAFTLAPQTLTFADNLTLATGLGILGRYADATSALDQAALEKTGKTGKTGSAAARLAERRAWLLGRQGDLAAARFVLEGALASSDSGSSAGAADFVVLRARLARLLVSLGRFQEALTIVSPLVGPDAGSPVPSAALEAAILAHAYAGQAVEARALHGRLVAAPGATPAGRVAYLGALIDQLGGHMQAAVAQYRGAFELTSALNDVHTLAAVALNLGALLAEQGAYGEALAATERAIRELGRLGSTAELGTALLNAANLLVLLGELAAARRAMARAQDEAAARGAPAVDAFANFVEGDLERRRGQPQSAARLYRSAGLRLLAQGQKRAGASALIAEAEALAETGRLTDAADAIREAVGHRDGQGSGTPGDESIVSGTLGGSRAPRDELGPAEPSLAYADDQELTLARARLILAGAPSDTHTPAALAAGLKKLAERGLQEGRRPAAWRAAIHSARLFHRLGNVPAAQEMLAQARKIFEEVRMATPEQHRMGLQSDPDAQWLGNLGAPAGQDASAALRAAHTENRLRRLLRINKRLNSEQRLPRLLETIIDTVIELTDAERGFILLEDEGGELAVRVARNIDQRTLDTAEFELSRSIARRAAAGGEPIVTIDAAGDDRFKEALSVSDLHLRSVLAVPLHIKGRCAGTIYVDHRLRKGAFDQDDVSLVLDFAEQAAIAIENARMVSQLRRRERQVDALNRRLEAELSVRREELTGMKQELRENREALAVRYDYRNIIGRTPRMLELFRLLDRITDTALPVVIQGESGTGKELVARAIHFNGPRRAQTFVSENCAAIPETLLESTLFGYDRGAFTGADHDTRGLFEVADGGTLFLDEIGEMSPGMQGKLLRVLQAGEFRRVGGQRTRKVDVRIVAATNRDLSRMVEEGKFRQDLYFRLNVARIFLPPLRERREDIPLIVDHMLVKHAGGAVVSKPVDAPALAGLIAYRWPGNVRELENEIMRAVALSGERITLADLSPAIASNGDGVGALPDNPDSLLLRPRVERLERSLLREALTRFGNNQTKAADALGLSRFGLQKKLKRYRFA